MIVRIIVDDKIVSLNNRPLKLDNLDWSVFDGDPTTPFDDIHAVHFDDVRGQGHVEYKMVMTKQASRPNIQPPDCPINATDFEAFAFVIPAYEAKKRQLQAEAEAQAAANAARANDPAPALVVEGVSREEAQRMAEKAAADAVAAFAAEIVKPAGG